MTDARAGLEHLQRLAEREATLLTELNEIRRAWTQTLVALRAQGVPLLVVAKRVARPLGFSLKLEDLSRLRARLNKQVQRARGHVSTHSSGPVLNP
jgi:hypothetical protein